MALSNIFKEPRREIIETMAGIVVAAIVIVPLCLFSCWFQSKTFIGDVWPGRITGMLVGIVSIVLMSGIAIVIHSIGEGVCESLDKRGLRLRPRQRYN